MTAAYTSISITLNMNITKINTLTTRNITITPATIIVAAVFITDIVLVTVFFLPFPITARIFLYWELNNAGIILCNIANFKISKKQNIFLIGT